MGTINLYKIESEKSKPFYKTLDTKMEKTKTIEYVTKGKQRDVFECTLYICVSEDERSIPWNWVLREYDEPEISVVSAPKGVLVIENSKKEIYAVTFGHAFFSGR